MHPKTSRTLAAAIFFLAASFLLGTLWGAGPGAVAAAPQEISLKQVKEFQLPTTPAGPPGRAAFTIYMDRKAEKVKAAQRMNALHDVMAGKGYTLHDVEPHWENSDLEGWWITYLPERGE